MYRKIFDVVSVWVATILAQVFNWFDAEFLKAVPMIKDLIGILSLLIAIAYTLYRFTKDWNGFLPWKKKKNNDTQ